MTHTLAIKKFTDKLLEIHFTASRWSDGFSTDVSVEAKNEATMVALRTLLIFNGYEEGDKSSRIFARQKDFAFAIKDGILIHGKSNVITALDLLYETPKLFSFQSTSQRTFKKERNWIASELIKRITRRMNDQDVSKVEREQFRIMVQKYCAIAAVTNTSQQAFMNAWKEIEKTSLANRVY